MKSIDVVFSGEKCVIIVGWNPLDENWVKLNTNEACIVGRASGCGCII